MSDLKKFAEQLVNLSIKEVNELAAILKEEHGIEPAATAPMMVTGGGGTQSVNGPTPAAEKTHYDVILKSAGTSKLGVVKIVKDITGLGLKEAKDLVDGAPKTLKEGITKADAESVKSKLEEAGAEIELK